QLLITASIAAVFVFYEPAKEWIQEQIILMFVCMGVFLIVQIMVFCCTYMARKVPLNYILLIIGTLAKTFVVSFICTHYYPKQILMALGITVIVVAALTLFAMFAPCDFTGCAVFLLVIGVIFLCLVIAQFFIKSSILAWCIIAVGLLMFSLYLVYDIQRMVKGNSKNPYSEEDYVVAALGIYIDIIGIFLLLLQLIGLLDN
ncbi:hypothetical protein KR222_003762, partial [Zaprionus bogoriensis]